MKKYRVPVVKTIYAFVEVDAESEMDAISAVNKLIDNEEIDDNLDESSVDYDVAEMVAENLLPYIVFSNEQNNEEDEKDEDDWCDNEM